MWKEVLIDNEEDIQKFIDIDNSAGCIAKVNPTNRNMILHILTKRDPHLFIYDDGKFQLLLAFIEKEEYILCLRMVLKWDYFDQSINPKDALYFTATKTLEYMKERDNKKIRMVVFSDEKVATLPDQHILDWYGDSMTPIYKSCGVRLIRYPNYFDVEVI